MNAVPSPRLVRTECGFIDPAELVFAAPDKLVFRSGTVLDDPCDDMRFLPVIELLEALEPAAAEPATWRERAPLA